MEKGNQIIRFYDVADDFGWLSNFAPNSVRLDGKLRPTVRHYFQAQKFTNKKYKENIRKAKNSKIAARMGRDQRYKLRSDWEFIKASVMQKAVKAKFTQHPDLRKMLITTGDTKLLEHTIKDAF